MSKRAIIEVDVKGEGRKRLPIDLDFSSGVARPATASAVTSSPIAATDGSWTTFTPTVTLVGGAGNTTPVYTTNTGRYTKIGKTVICSVELTGDGGAEGAGSGVLNVTLPVAVAAQLGATKFVVGRMINNALISVLIGTLAAAATTVSLSYKDAIGTEASATGAQQNNATRTIQLHFAYEVD